MKKILKKIINIFTSSNKININNNTTNTQNLININNNQELSNINQSKSFQSESFQPESFLSYTDKKSIDLSEVNLKLITDLKNKVDYLNDMINISSNPEITNNLKEQLNFYEEQLKNNIDNQFIEKNNEQLLNNHNKLNNLLSTNELHSNSNINNSNELPDINSITESNSVKVVENLKDIIENIIN